MSQSKGEEKDIAGVVARVVRHHGSRPEKLVGILQDVQKHLKYLPEVAMQAVAEALEIAPVAVWEVATFYNRFRFHPPGRHSVRVCLGTACHMKGGYIALDAWKRRLEIEEGQTTADGEYDLDTVACVGCCVMAPVTVVDSRPEAEVTPTKVDGILLALENRRQKKASA